MNERSEKCRVTKTESETIVGVDEFKLPIVDCPEVVLGAGESKKFGKYWYKCPDCEEEVFHEENGKSYYHLLKCKRSNGIGYGVERSNTTIPHHKMCDCFTCHPPKAK